MRYLITSALPYINGIKHLGNLAGSMLPADVHARFRRLQGKEVLFICATDEHGTPAELAAIDANMPVDQYCDQLHTIQSEIYNKFNLSFDHFGRTSNPPNHSLTQHFCQKLDEAGLIREKTTKQLYSVIDNRFLPDRYVVGTCPKCSFDHARGDQCDNCGALMEPSELISPRSQLSNNEELELKSTTHLYLQQQLVQSKLRKWVNTCDKWPKIAKSIAYKWLDEGLRERSITRDLNWGVKVMDGENKRLGFESKVFYVWFDAPIGYIGSTVEWAMENDEDWQRWWRTDKGAHDVEYIQFMGKDNVAFHTTSFPITLLGSGEDWKMVDQLKAFNWLTWYGGKFSTSQNRGLFMNDALELLDSDSLRWFLTSNAPENADCPFTFERLQEVLNSDLANVFGNFINRTIKLVPRVLSESGVTKFEKLGENHILNLQLKPNINRLTRYFETLESRKAASELRAIWAIGNEYLQDQAPWKELKTNPDGAKKIILAALNLICLFAVLAQPIIPRKATQVLDVFKVNKKNRAWPTPENSNFLQYITESNQVTQLNELEVLFHKISDDKIDEWLKKYPA